MPADVTAITPEVAQQRNEAAELRTMVSMLIERMQWAKQHGMSFSGARDMYEVLGYERILTPTMFRQRYSRGGLAGRIVDALPKATWRGGIEVVEDEDPQTTTAFEAAFKELNERLRIWATLLKADLLSQQGRYSIILLGAKGELDQELEKASKPEELLYLTPFPEEDAQVKEWETDSKNPRFGLPLYYQLTRLSANRYNLATGSPAFTSADLVRPVHWSRVIHVVADNALDNDVFGQPALERVWNLLDDLDKVTGGGAEAFWLRANQGLQLDVDKDIKGMGADEKAALKTQIEEYKHQISRILTTRGVTANTLGSDVANFSNPADAIVTQIAGAKGIPKRILTGSEMGELASSQDRENWKDQVNGRQVGHASPNIARPLIDRLTDFNFLPKPKKYELVWPQIEVLSETEKSTGAKDWASTTTAEGPVFSNAEIRDRWYGMKPLEKPVVVAGQPGSSLSNPQLQVEAEEGVDPKTGRPIVDGETQEELARNSPSRSSAGEEEEVAGNVVPMRRRRRLAVAEAEAAQYEPLLEALTRALAEGDNDTLDDILGITKRRKALHQDWDVRPEGLTRTYKFPNRRMMAAFMMDLSRYSNEENHHPDMTTRETSITVSYTTHQAGNVVTDLDFISAAHADRLWEKYKEPIGKTNEPLVLQERKFASTQFNIPRALARDILQYGMQVSDEDLHEEGRDSTPHVTIKYGIHSDDPKPVQEVLAEHGQKSIGVMLGQTSVFEAEEYDVLHLKVHSGELHQLNQLISSQLEVTDTHPVYTPHITIAYLKKGRGQRYANDPVFDGQQVILDTVVFSPADDAKGITSIKLA